MKQSPTADDLRQALQDSERRLELLQASLTEADPAEIATVSARLGAEQQAVEALRARVEAADLAETQERNEAEIERLSQEYDRLQDAGMELQEQYDRAAGEVVRLGPLLEHHRRQKQVVVGKLRNLGDAVRPDCQSPWGWQCQ